MSKTAYSDINLCWLYTYAHDSCIHKCQPNYLPYLFMAYFCILRSIQVFFISFWERQYLNDNILFLSHSHQTHFKISCHLIFPSQMTFNMIALCELCTFPQSENLFSLFIALISQISDTSLSYIKGCRFINNVDIPLSVDQAEGVKPNSSVCMSFEHPLPDSFSYNQTKFFFVIKKKGRRAPQG